MTPVEIKIELLKKSITQTEIARRAGVQYDSIVTRVINYERTSYKVRKEIAKTLGEKVEQVFTAADAKKAKAAQQKRAA